MIQDCTIADSARVWFPEQVNIYGCTIGACTNVGPFVEIQRGVTIGEMCKIESHSFICSHVYIGDYVFIGHGVMFTNDRYPVILSRTAFEAVIVEDYVSIGSGAVIGPGVKIGERAIIGAGSVIVDNVPPLSIVAGNPAKVVRKFRKVSTMKSYIDKRQKKIIEYERQTRNHRLAVSGFGKDDTGVQESDQPVSVSA